MTLSEFRLFCWILGGSNAFSVKIGKSETVDDLKAEIKKKKEHELHHLDADALNVWKLSPPIHSAEVDAKLGHVQCPEEILGCIKLDPFKEISQLFESPPPEHLHIVVEVPPTPSRKHSSPVEEDSCATKRMRITQPAAKRWAVGGEIREIDKAGCYYLDPGTQDDAVRCLSIVLAGQFMLLWGSRASGKTTLLFWLRKELLARGYQALYISFGSINYKGDVSTFWQSLGDAVDDAASTTNLEYPDFSTRISSQDELLRHFRKENWKQDVILIFDELSDFYYAKPEICNDCLQAFRKIRDSEVYAIRSIVAAGTLVVCLEPSSVVIPPFIVSQPYFSLEGIMELFRVFALDNHITIDDAVVEDIWAKSNGHPVMVCLCGQFIFNYLLSLIKDSANLSYRTWQQFPANMLYNEISYKTTMLALLFRPQARASVTLLRSRFVGFLDKVVLEDVVEQDLGNFLTSEGILLKPNPAQPHYFMASPLVDGVIRNRLIPQLFPDCPSSVPQDEGEGLHVLATLIESLKFFDRTLIHLSASCSYKNVIMPSVPNGHVPRESVYDTELLRILLSWLRNHYHFTVIGQWHLQNMKQHQYSYIVIKNEEEDPPIVLSILATGDSSLVKLHVQRTLEFMAFLSAKEAWVVHFTCEQDYHPVWQSDVELSEGVNMVHFAHDLEFRKVMMSTCWKDHSGNVHQDNNQLLNI